VIFEYNSTRTGLKKRLDPILVEDIRLYILRQNLTQFTSKGKLQEILLAYRDGKDKPLLINQLEPIFTYLALRGGTWPQEYLTPEQWKEKAKK